MHRGSEACAAALASASRRAAAAPPLQLPAPLSSAAIAASSEYSRARGEARKRSTEHGALWLCAAGEPRTRVHTLALRELVRLARNVQSRSRHARIPITRSAETFHRSS